MAIIPFPVRRGSLQREEFTAAYVDCLRAGVAETQAHFFSYFSRLILIKTRTRGCCHPEDIQQETFRRVWAALGSPEGLRDPACLGAFVSRLCSHVISEHFRDHGRHPEASDLEYEPTDACGPNPEEQLVKSQQQERVHRTLQKLRPRDRRVLSALFLNDEERDALRRELRLTQEALRILLVRARARFRAAYVADEGTQNQIPQKDAPRWKAR
jgi:RNA polymerase sigma factor (sigma-70 family)